MQACERCASTRHRQTKLAPASTAASKATPRDSRFGGKHCTADSCHRGSRHFEAHSRTELPARGPGDAWARPQPHGNRGPNRLARVAPDPQDGAKHFVPWASRHLPTAAGASGTAGSRGQIGAWPNHKPRLERPIWLGRKPFSECGEATLHSKHPAPTRHRRGCGRGCLWPAPCPTPHPTGQSC